MALVSRRFAALVWACVPDLKLKVEANGLQSLPALRLLAGWLRRSGQHLCQLTLPSSAGLRSSPGHNPRLQVPGLAAHPLLL